jgi:hypothetical protein
VAGPMVAKLVDLVRPSATGNVILAKASPISAGPGMQPGLALSHPPPNSTLILWKLKRNSLTNEFEIVDVQLAP